MRLTWMMTKMRRRMWKMTAWKSPQANPAIEQRSQSLWRKAIMTSDPSAAGPGGTLKCFGGHVGQELIAPCHLKSARQHQFRSW